MDDKQPYDSAGLEVDSVMHAFGERPVLTDVSLRCAPGEVVAIYGRNGSGKSTLFNIIFGTLYSEGRFVRIDGRVALHPAFRTGRIAYLPQQDFLPKEMRVEKVVRLYMTDRAAREAFFAEDEAMGRIARTRVRDLSGGELRYLEILLILRSPARYLLLDEPFSGLSPVTAAKVREAISRSALTRGIVMSDHNFREVARIAGRYLLLQEGCLREVHSEEELRPYLRSRGYGMGDAPQR